jgi:hypothetical protein
MKLQTRFNNLQPRVRGIFSSWFCNYSRCWRQHKAASPEEGLLGASVGAIGHKRSTTSFMVIALKGCDIVVSNLRLRAHVGNLPSFNILQRSQSCQKFASFNESTRTALLTMSLFLGVSYSSRYPTTFPSSTASCLIDRANGIYGRRPICVSASIGYKSDAVVRTTKTGPGPR